MTAAYPRPHNGAAPAFEPDWPDIIRNGPIGIYTSTPQGRFLSVNPAMAHLLGYESSEELIDSINDISTQLYVDPSDRDGFKRKLELHGQLVDHQFRMRRKDGSTIWVTNNARILNAAEGTVLYQGFIIDISDRKKTEDSLRLSEERSRIIFENSPLGMLLFDNKGTIIDCNDAAVVLMGSSREKLVGFSAAQLDSPMARAAMLQAMSGKAAVVEGEYTSLTGGVTRTLRGHFNPILRNGSPTGIMATLEDTSDRYRTEQALQESERLRHTLLDILPLGVVIVDVATREIELVNDCALSLFNGTVEQLQGKRCHSLLCPAKDGACPVCDLGRVVENSEREMLRADGSRLPILKTVKRIHLDGREKLLECFVDLSQQKQVEEKLQNFALTMEFRSMELEEARLKAEQAAREKSDFLSRMSHEIRTPLNGVVGMVELLLTTDLNETQRRYVQTMRASGDALLTVINDILDFSKIEAGSLELECLDFHLRPLLDSIASMLAVSAADKKLELVCTVDSDVPDHFSGEPGRLRQILTNLAGNAIKFTHAGEVEIRVSLAEAARESRKDDPATLDLLFSVRDTGIGIPENALNRLFQVYSQAGVSTSRHFGGTGLGLAISKQLTEMMGGEIGVQSAEGRGSTFWFSIPMRRVLSEDDTAAVPEELHNLRVLIVDDNTTCRETLLSRLSAMGMRPEEAHDATSAMNTLHAAIFRNDPFQLAFIDMDMPDMSGEALGRTIHADDALFAGLRMVLMTSLGQRGSAGQFVQAGFVMHLCKPVLHGELHSCLNRVMSGGTPPTSFPDDTLQRTTADGNGAALQGRVLLAEDNVTNQQVALGILAGLGLQADVVDNGAEVLSALRRTRYDVILMDVQMPVMNGIECTRIIRDPATPGIDHRIPIVAMTAHADSDSRTKCRESGMNDHISKPISVQAMMTALGPWIPALGARPVLSTPAHPGFDLQIWDRGSLLERVMGDEELVVTIIEGFRIDVAGRVEVMRRRLCEGVLHELVMQAHNIKGAASNLGSTLLRTAAMTLESAARSGDTDACEKHLARLEETLARLTAEFELHGLTHT